MTLWRSQTSGEDPRSPKQWLRSQPYATLIGPRLPPILDLDQLRRLLSDCFYRVAGSGQSWSERAYSYAGSWKLVMITPMSFQDLNNYDFATMSDSKTPVATQEGEITFCAYNGGRWRKIVEHLHQTASLAEWKRMHGRQPIYAKGKEVDLGAGKNAKAELVQIENQRTPA